MTKVIVTQMVGEMQTTQYLLPTMTHRRRKPRKGDASRPEEDNSVEWGGESIWAVGYTEGGAPFGLTESETREVSRDVGGGPDWADAAGVLREVLADAGSGRGSVDVGWVQYLGEGLTHVAFGATPRLLHGDLLGQNLLRSWEGGPPGVLDWSEARLGDPAYDLAIVTRGVRRPFQVSEGLPRLLEEYNRHAEQPLSAAEVHVHELCLRGKLFLDAVADHGARSAHAESLQRAMVGVLRRAEGA